MANRLRGEVEVELFGQKLRLVPDMQSICEIEDATDGDLSLVRIFRQVLKEEFPLKSMAVVLYGCMKAAGVKAPQAAGEAKRSEHYTLPEVMYEIRKRGLCNYVGNVGVLVSAMVSREELESDEKKGEPENARSGKGSRTLQASTG